MKISVLMSTYNGEKYIVEQLESLLAQSRKIDEMIFVDDCSTDDTVNIIRAFIQTHYLEDSWKVYVNEENLGWRANFMHGISKTSGNVLFFSDQDDIWLENKVEVMTQLLFKNPQIQVAASNETIWTGEPVKKRLVSSNAFDIIELGATGREYFIRCSGCTMAIKRAYIDRTLKYHKCGWAHDDFFWKMASIDGVFALVRESTILHRIHGSNESRKKRTLASTLSGIHAEIMIADQMLQYIEDSSSNNHAIPNAPAKKKIILHKKLGNALRLRFFETRNPVLLMHIALRFSDIYRRKRQILKDLLLSRQQSS